MLKFDIKVINSAINYIMLLEINTKRLKIEVSYPVDLFFCQKKIPAQLYESVPGFTNVLREILS